MFALILCNKMKSSITYKKVDINRFISKHFECYSEFWPQRVQRSCTVSSAAIEYAVQSIQGFHYEKVEAVSESLCNFCCCFFVVFCCCFFLFVFFWGGRGVQNTVKPV